MQRCGEKAANWRHDSGLEATFKVHFLTILHGVIIESNEIRVNWATTSTEPQPVCGNMENRVTHSQKWYCLAVIRKQAWGQQKQVIVKTCTPLPPHTCSSAATLKFGVWILNKMKQRIRWWWWNKAYYQLPRKLRTVVRTTEYLCKNKSKFSDCFIWQHISIQQFSMEPQVRK